MPSPSFGQRHAHSKRVLLALSGPGYEREPRRRAVGSPGLPSQPTDPLSVRCCRASALPHLCSFVGVGASRVRLCRGRLSAATC